MIEVQRNTSHEGRNQVSELSEWIREVLFRELRDSDQMNSYDHINYGKRLLTEIVWSASFPDPCTFSHVTGRVAGRRTIRGNHAAGEGRDFGGATTDTHE
jgi:hypothetical protein